MFFLRRLRQAYYTPLMNPPIEFSTQVLKCDPSSISFASDYPTISCSDTSRALDIAAHHLRDLSQIVVFPTETVYGLGAFAQSAQATSNIFSTKGRPPDNPLIVHVSSLTMLRTLLPLGYNLSRVYKALIKHFWPGPLTLLFPRNADIIPTIVTANQSSVAIRMPSHPVARALIAVSNLPLAAPSANSSGKPSPTRVEHVLRDLDGKVPIILDGGACDVGLESTVVDGLQADGNIRVLRPGGITIEEIERVLRQEMHDCAQIPKVLVHRRDFQDKTIENAPTTPGMKYRHYSPSVPVTLICTSSSPPQGTNPLAISAFLDSLVNTNNKVKIGVLAPSDSKLWRFFVPKEGLHWRRYDLGPIADPSVTAHRLFDGLLTLEKEGVHLILIEEVKEDREGLAIMNRVRKAAGDSVWVSLPPDDQ
jgi:L-threonylcarbamoyladenylate synthase